MMMQTLSLSLDNLPYLYSLYNVSHTNKKYLAGFFLASNFLTEIICFLNFILFAEITFICYLFFRCIISLEEINPYVRKHILMPLNSVVKELTLSPSYSGHAWIVQRHD